MRLLFRLALWIVLVSTGLVVAGWTCIWWAPEGGLTWNDLREYQEALERGRWLDEEVQVRVEVCMWRIQHKYQIAREVLAGRVSLVEAAVQFRALNEQAPTIEWESYRSSHPGRNDAERHCHEVFRFAQQIVADEQTPSDSVLDRLRDELSTLLERPAPLRLPAQPTTTATAPESSANASSAWHG
jgi:hypothetical protein